MISSRNNWYSPNFRPADSGLFRAWLLIVSGQWSTVEQMFPLINMVYYRKCLVFFFYASLCQALKPGFTSLFFLLLWMTGHAPACVLIVIFVFNKMKLKICFRTFIVDMHVKLGEIYVAEFEIGKCKLSFQDRDCLGLPIMKLEEQSYPALLVFRGGSRGDGALWASVTGPADFYGRAVF